jgi:hypothetical protein
MNSVSWSARLTKRWPRVAKGRPLREGSGEASYPLEMRSCEDDWRKGRSSELRDISRVTPMILAPAPGVVRHGAWQVFREVAALGAVPAVCAKPARTNKCPAA